jgi:hypothetical protein
MTNLSQGPIIFWYDGYHVGWLLNKSQGKSIMVRLKKHVGFMMRFVSNRDLQVMQ